MMILSTSNMKMNNEGITSGTLYKTQKHCLSSCPYNPKNKARIGLCYGSCGNLNFPHVKAKQVKNTSLISRYTRQGVLAYKLGSEIEKMNIDYVRFSGKGELACKEELSQYCDLARNFPQKRFIIYTRKLDLVEACINEIPSNFKVNLSITGMTETECKNAVWLASKCSSIGYALIFKTEEGLKQTCFTNCSDSEALSYQSKFVGLLDHAKKAAAKRVMNRKMGLYDKK